MLSSGAIRDARIYRAAVAAAQSTGPSATRLGALRVLMKHYDPTIEVSDGFLERASVGSSLPRNPHPMAVAAAEPLDGSIRMEVGQLLARLSSSDGDPLVKRAAGTLRQALAYADAANTPISRGAVALIAQCGQRVLIRSTSDVNMGIQVQVLNSNFKYSYSLGYARNGAPTDMLVGLPKGIVVASYGGREIARLTERNASCPPGQDP